MLSRWPLYIVKFVPPDTITKIFIEFEAKIF